MYVRNQSITLWIEIEIWGTSYTNEDFLCSEIGNLYRKFYDTPKTRSNAGAYEIVLTLQRAQPWRPTDRWLRLASTASCWRCPRVQTRCRQDSSCQGRSWKHFSKSKMKFSKGVHNLIEHLFSAFLVFRHPFWHKMFQGTLNRYKPILRHPYKPNLLKITGKVCFGGTPTDSYVTQGFRSTPVENQCGKG